MNTEMYDLIVIGGGTVGFDGIRTGLASGAKKIAMVERAEVGGTCLNWG
jgi:pyruvate/2-oxoglutarate dehydrogenase complex dihydrolipoamide dehydrogenase (E3) component